MNVIKPLNVINCNFRSISYIYQINFNCYQKLSEEQMKPILWRIQRTTNFKCLMQKRQIDRWKVTKNRWFRVNFSPCWLRWFPFGLKGDHCVPITNLNNEIVFKKHIFHCQYFKRVAPKTFRMDIKVVSLNWNLSRLVFIV